MYSTKLNLLTITFLLSQTLIQGQQSLSKTFKTLSVRQSDWEVLETKPEYKSWELCRQACVLADSQCQAYSFNEPESHCEFGSFSNDDVIKVAFGNGKKVFYEESAAPSLKTHVALIGGRCMDTWDFEFGSNTGSNTPWFAKFPNAGLTSLAHLIGMYYDTGFLVCSGYHTPQKCQYQELGSDAWVDMPDMLVARHRPAFVIYGDNMMWVLGGSQHPTYFKTTEVFFNGKWINGPALPHPDGVQEPCAQKIGNNEVFVGGGYAGAAGYVTKGYIFSRVTEEWTDIGSYSGTARDNFACGSHTKADGEILVFLACGYNGALLTDVDAFSSVTRQWISMNPYPSANPDGTLLSLGDKFLLIPGVDTTKMIKQWDETSDTWADVMALPGGHAACSFKLAIKYNL